MLTILKQKKIFSKNITSGNHPQIFDLLQLSRKERESRAACRRLIREFESWKKQQASEKDFSVRLYGEIEGIMLRRQAQDAVLLYRMIRRDRIRMFAEYVEKLPMQKNIFRAAS